MCTVVKYIEIIEFYIPWGPSESILVKNGAVCRVFQIFRNDI